MEKNIAIKIRKATGQGLSRYCKFYNKKNKCLEKTKIKQIASIY